MGGRNTPREEIDFFVVKTKIIVFFFFFFSPPVFLLCILISILTITATNRFEVYQSLLKSSILVDWMK